MSIDRGSLDQQLKALGEGSRWWDQREMRDLPAVLTPDEHILAISRGKVGRIRWLRRSWLIVVTDKRLLCMRSSRGPSWRQFELTATQMVRVAIRLGLFRGRVVVETDGNTYKLLVPKTDAYKIASVLSTVARGGQSALSGPGATRMVKRVIDHVLALPAAAFNPEASTGLMPIAPPAPPPSDSREDVLENQIEQLQAQVEFLEDLLQQRQNPALPGGETKVS
jgi:hypothetical protein